jgi:hypothetical protein
MLGSRQMAEFWSSINFFLTEHAAAVNLLSLSFGLVGIILAVAFYRAGKPVHCLSYATRTFRIISEKAQKVQGLEVTFHGVHVNAISITRMAIWNGGTEALRSADISDGEPLVIRPRDNVNILRADLVESTSGANRPSIEPVAQGGASGYLFHFEFLNPGDGVVISLVHDGTDVADLTLTGTLVGARVRKAGADPETVTTAADPHGATTIINVESPRTHHQSFALMLSAVGIVVSGLSLFVEGFGPIIMGPLFFFGGVGLYFYVKRKYPPSRLKMYDDNL